MVKIKGKGQYFSTMNDFPTTPKEIVDKYHRLIIYDNDNKGRQKPGVELTKKGKI